MHLFVYRPKKISVGLIGEVRPRAFEILEPALRPLPHPCTRIRPPRPIQVAQCVARLWGQPSSAASLCSGDVLVSPIRTDRCRSPHPSVGSVREAPLLLLVWFCTRRHS